MEIELADNTPAPPAPAAEQPPPPEHPPNQTIYVNNISEKIKIPSLITELKAIFNQFGTIVEIQAKKNLRMRGQAFIVFQDIESAKKAVTSMQGFPFHDKKMRIAFAKDESDVISKDKGTYVERKKPKKVKKKKTKDKKAAAANPMAAMLQMMNPQMMMQMQKMMAQTGMQMPSNMTNMAQMMPQMQANMQKMMKQMQDQMTKTATTKQPNMGLPEGKFGVNNIIFVQDMPAEVDEKMLSCLFEQFNGFIEVRMAPARPGAGKAAFIEYETESTAAHAKDTLQGFKITPQCQLKITFAKK